MLINVKILEGQTFSDHSESEISFKISLLSIKAKFTVMLYFNS